MILTIIPLAPDMAPVDKVLYSVQTQSVKFPYLLFPAGHPAKDMARADKINNLVTARNAIFDFAMKTGIEYFLMLDADCVLTDTYSIENLLLEIESNQELVAVFAKKHGETCDTNHAGFGAVMFNTMNLLKSGLTIKYFGRDCECLNFCRDVKNTKFKINVGHIESCLDLHQTIFY
jgi:hypothetical protein